VLQTALTLAFAATGFGVFSFVLPMPLVYTAVAVVLWAVARPVIRICNPFRHWRFLVGDSAYIFGQYFLQTVVGQGDYIILGTLFGDTVVGPYFFAYGMAKQAIQLTAGSIQTALMAGLARMPTFSDQQTRAALRATKGLSLVGIPLCLVQAAVARPFLVGLYGDKWVEAIPLVQLISVGMAFDVAAWAACSLFQSRGQFRFLFIWSSVSAPIFIALIFVGAIYGQSLGVAVALCIFNTVFSPMLVCWIFRASNIPWSEILGIYTRPLLIGMLSAGASTIAIIVSGAVGFQLLLQCGFAIGAGLIIMGISASLIAPDTWMEIMVRLKGLIPPFLLARRRTEN
jgi:PST family polysaccharide transporter